MSLAGLCEILRRTFEYYLSSIVTGLWAKVNYPVCRLDYVEIMFHDYQ